MSSTKRKALIVDDDIAIRRIVAKLMERLGYVVVQAENGRAATEAIREHHPNIVITDWEMPELNGPELCRWIRSQELPHYTYIIMLTVRTASQDMIESLDSGADDFVKKPIDIEELTARLRSAERVWALEQRLRSLANHDALTGLATQRTFYEDLTAEWGRSVRHHVPLSCVMLDIDFFKRINDTYGHPAGDEVIRKVADTLSSGIRGSDVVSRFGGEEYCVLLPETSEGEAQIWAERMRQRISAMRIKAGGAELQVTASLGIAQRMPDTKSPQELVDMADQALLVAKRSGRDRVVTFGSLNQSVAESQDEFSPEKLFEGLSARDVMTAIVTGLSQDEMIGSAVEFFLRFRINSAPVVDDNGKLVGILSERDAMAVMLCNGWWNKRIKDVMKSNVVCYEESTSALSIYEFLCRVTLRTAVIVKNGHPTGLINRGGLLRWFANSATVRRPGDEDESDSSSRPIRRFPPPREQLIATAAALAVETKQLSERMMECDKELLACVVGGASRVQELVTDLLSFSRGLAEKEYGCEPGAGAENVRGLAGLLEAMRPEEQAAYGP